MSSQIFPALPGIAIGVKRTPIFSTLVQASPSGKETRASFQSYPRYRFEIPLNFARKAGFSAQTIYDEAGTLASFFAQHRGQWDSFLYPEPYDSADTAMGFGVGNGSQTVFQLQRREPGNYTNVLGTFPVPSTPRTNLAVRSQELGNAAWTKGNATITANVVISPDNAANGCKIVEDSTNNDHVAYQTFTATAQPYTFSIYLKAAERGWALVQLGSATAYVNIAAGVLGNISGCIASIQSIKNGWFRVSITVVMTAGGALFGVHNAIGNGISQVYLGDGTSGIYVWGAQLEVGSSATEFILTTSSQVTVVPSYYPGTDGFEPVTEPAPGLLIYKNGVQLGQGIDFFVGVGGVITFATAPLAGDVLTWTGGYYRRCRFETDEMEMEQIVNLVWKTANLKLISVK